MCGQNALKIETKEGGQEHGSSTVTSAQAYTSAKHAYTCKTCLGTKEILQQQQKDNIMNQTNSWKFGPMFIEK